MFVWWNLLFPWLDLAYTLFFIPGVILALFGIYWIAGPLTLALLPMALGINYMMYRVGSQMFAANGLRVRRNVSGFLVYAFVYSLILQPACVAGYFPEILGLRKSCAHEVICALVAALVSCLAWHTSYNRSTRCLDAPDYAYRDVSR